jgi:predicted component of type VI protein secretion system
MSKPVYRLVMRRGPTPGTVFELSKSDMTIGRDLGNDYVINDVEISRKHLRLLLQGENYIIEDLGSTNGSFVNGQRLTGSHVLIPGDLISLGEHVTLVVEASAYDPDATRLSAAAGPTVIAGQSPAPVKAAVQRPAAQPEQRPSAAPAARPAAQAAQPQQPAPSYDMVPPAQYAGQIPPGPDDELVDAWEAPRKKPISPWLIAGGGCILIVICFLVALLVFIDQPWSDSGLYCTTPFDIIFRFFGYCP